MDTISEILNKPVELSNNFPIEINSSYSSWSNIISIKCTKTLFSKKGLKNNISSYILLIFIAQFLLSIVLFMKCGYHLLINDINEIIKEKEKIKKQMDINNRLTTGQNKGVIKKGKKKSNKRKLYFPPKKIDLNFMNNNNYKRKINLVNKASTLEGLKQPSTMNKKRGTTYRKNLNKGNRSKLNKKRDNEISESNYHLNTNRNNNQKKSIKIIYNDYELSTFDYENAILNDKRTCFQYYLSLIKTKNIIIFSFCPNKDYNSMIIKLCIFSLSFSINYAFNFAFFNDEILHKIYEAGGKYDIIYFIPKIAISFAASYYITIIIKIIFLSERNIAIIRRQYSPSLAYIVSDKEKTNMVIKYVIFFIIGLIFLVFFWMLLSSFGAVYPNTQIFILKNTLISFTMSLIYPFFFSIFPCSFRMCSLSSNNNECLYKVSKALQIL